MQKNETEYSSTNWAFKSSYGLIFELKFGILKVSNQIKGIAAY